MHLERLSHFDAALRDRHAAIGDDDFMNAAVILRDFETREEPAVVVGLSVRDRPGRLCELLSAEVKVIFDHPAAADGLPQQIDGSSRRETFGDGFDLRADDRFLSAWMSERQGF